MTPEELLNELEKQEGFYPDEQMVSAMLQQEMPSIRAILDKFFDDLEALHGHTSKAEN